MSENEETKVTVEKNDFDEFLKNQKKQLFLQRIATGCMAGIMVVVIIIAVILVPQIETTLSHINSVATNAEKSLENVDTMTSSLTTASDNLNDLVNNNAEGLSEAIKSISDVDFESLNQAIKDLQDAIGPLAAFMKRFG